MLGLYLNGLMFWEVCAIWSLEKNFLLGLVRCWKLTAVVLSVDWSIMWHFAHVQAAVLKQRILQFSGYVWTENQVCCCVHHFLILCCGFSGGKDLCEEWGCLTWVGFVLMWYFIISLMTCLRLQLVDSGNHIILACVKVAIAFCSIFVCTEDLYAVSFLWWAGEGKSKSQREAGTVYQGGIGSAHWCSGPSSAKDWEKGEISPWTQLYQAGISGFSYYTLTFFQFTFIWDQCF